MKKMLFIFLLIIIFSGCEIFKKASIEKEDILSFRMFEVYEDKAVYIVISGHIFWSSYNYKEIKINNSAQTKNIIMYAELVGLTKNATGTFNITIPIEENINRVSFGNNNEIIWERKTTETLAHREKLLELPRFTPYNDVINQFGEPDAVVGSGLVIIQYTLNNNRRAELNFAGGEDLQRLSEVFGYTDENELKNENLIFGF
ncbi:MAG: hypothetical protein LBI28_11175 [Treponema sp.]|jgi:hypothetical protein|nr:hypothetical protein [Treponema sp.]